MLIVLRAIHAPHTPAAEALPDPVLALAPGYTPRFAVSSFIPRAALAATSRAAAPSVGAYIAATAPFAVKNVLADIGSSGMRAPGFFVRITSLARLPFLLLM
jgi:hypothetical protein